MEIRTLETVITVLNCQHIGETKIQINKIIIEQKNNKWLDLINIIESSRTYLLWISQIHLWIDKDNTTE